MSVSKACGVCGGHIRPTSDESNFGYCESCGIVYLLREGPFERAYKGPPGKVEKPLGELYDKKGKPREIEISVAGLQPSKRHQWKCPDCDAVMEYDDEADLDFVKREHIREYHPNRSAG